MSRITLVLVGLVAAALLGLGVALYIGVRGAAWQQHDAGLVARAQALAAITESEVEGLEIELPAMHGAFAEAWGPDGEVLARSPGWQGDLPARTGTFDLTLPDGRAGRAFGLRFHPRDEERPTHDRVLLVLAETTDDVAAAGTTVRTRFLVLGAIILALVINGMNLLDIKAQWQPLIVGVVLLAAVLVDLVGRGHRERIG
jgi:hypothetical protein